MSSSCSNINLIRLSILIIPLVHTSFVAYQVLIVCVLWMVHISVLWKVCVLVHLPRSIMRACANLGVVDDRVVDAVQVRQELDLRIGVWCEAVEVWAY